MPTHTHTHRLSRDSVLGRNSAGTRLRIDTAVARFGAQSRIAQIALALRCLCVVLRIQILCREALGSRATQHHMCFDRALGAPDRPTQRASDIGALTAVSLKRAWRFFRTRST